MSEVVCLNVGGQIFHTTMKTLENTVLVRCKHDRDLHYDSYRFNTNTTGEYLYEGCHFVDRDPTHFRLILNFLRDGTVVVPSNTDSALELKQEAKFYDLPGLVLLIEEELVKRGSDSPAH